MITTACLAMLALPPRAALAQSSPPDAARESTPCFGFRFGAWTPALDWTAAGHGAGVDTARVPRTADGRGWALVSGSTGSDSVLIVFPVWWPAGVVIDLDPRRLMVGDTVTAVARAMVADGRVESPTSRIRAWRVSCGGAPPPRSP